MRSRWTERKVRGHELRDLESIVMNLTRVVRERSLNNLIVLLEDKNLPLLDDVATGVQFLVEMIVEVLEAHKLVDVARCLLSSRKGGSF